MLDGEHNLDRSTSHAYTYLGKSLPLKIINLSGVQFV